MSRPLRIEFEGAWYHVMNRGAARKKIFHTDPQRKFFLHLLREIHRKYKIEIHAYCLMSNHYHLLVKTPLANLHRCMHHLNSIYAQFFNRICDIDGPLFRGRYKAILINAEDYLLRVSRYIHLNPVEAKICRKTENYKWSSYNYYVSKKERPKWLSCSEILDRFNSEKLKYKKFVEEGIDKELFDFYKKLKKIPVLGSKCFLKSITETYLKPELINREISEKGLIKKLFIPTPDDIFKLVEQHYQININDIKFSKKGKKNLPRSTAMYLLAEHGQMTFIEISNLFGNITRNGVSNVCIRISKAILKNSDLQAKINELVKKLLNMGHVAT